MTKPIKNNKTERININVTTEQKEIFFKLATAEGLSVTDYILWKCIDTDKPDTKVKPQQALNSNNNDLLEYQVRSLSEQLEEKRQEIAERKQQMQELQSSYNRVVNALAYHSLPFWKKFSDKLELPNKTK